MVGRPFSPGQSGNPGGRPKMPDALRELLQREAEASVRTLVALRDDPEQPGSVRDHAANSLLDRGFGKPQQAVAITSESTEEADEERRAFAERLVEAARSAAVGLAQVKII